MMIRMLHAVGSMRKGLLALLVAAAMSAGAGSVRAAAEEEGGLPEGRLQGYQKFDNKIGSLALPEADQRGNAGTWFLLGGLGLLAVGVMFKSGKRTHLD
jgi:hypothetical protein